MPDRPDILWRPTAAAVEAANLTAYMDRLRAVPAVPRTLSGKVVEVPVKRILTGADPAKVVSRGSLANPEALDWFVGLAESTETIVTN